MAGTVVASVINNDTGLFSTNNAYLGIAKAWVSWTGSTGTSLQSFNVSSVTRNSTGNYTVNFTTAMSNANYVVSGSGSFSQYADTVTLWLGTTTPSTTSCPIGFGAGNVPTVYANTMRDPIVATAVFHGA
jgi:hypothetical protein